jgi:hypothetical protein
MLFLNSWRVSSRIVRYDISPSAIQKQHWHSREAQIELPLMECEWAFRIRAYVSKCLPIALSCFISWWELVRVSARVIPSQLSSTSVPIWRHESWEGQLSYNSRACQLSLTLILACQAFIPDRKLLPWRTKYIPHPQIPRLIRDVMVNIYIQALCVWH